MFKLNRQHKIKDENIYQKLSVDPYEYQITVLSIFINISCCKKKQKNKKKISDH